MAPGMCVERIGELPLLVMWWAWSSGDLCNQRKRLPPEREAMIPQGSAVTKISKALPNLAKTVRVTLRGEPGGGGQDEPWAAPLS